MHSLHQAITRDVSGNLQTLENFMHASEETARQTLFQEILFAWSGSSQYGAGSRGAYIDGRKLYALEAFMGQGFIQGGSPNPGANAGAVLQSAYQKLSQTLYVQLLAQTGPLKAVFDSIGLNWNGATQTFDLDLTAVVSALRAEYAANATTGLALIKDFATCLSASGEFGQQVIRELVQSGSIAGQGVDLFLTRLESNWMRGGSGDDTLGDLSSAQNVIVGGAGNDILKAGNLNDVLVGGTGNDTLNAGSGIDTFIFNQGDGQDRIVEVASYNKTGAKNQDVLQLGAGLLASATQLVRGVGSASNDLTLVFGGGDQVTLSNYFSIDYRLQTIRFADGTTWDYAAVTGKLVYAGTAGNDVLTGLLNAANNIDGGAGNDTITAGKLNDILAGGTGDDTLNAGYGIDTFVFNQGDGQDRIVEVPSYYKTVAKNQDVLQLGAGLLASATQLVRGVGSASNDLTLVFGGGDQVTLPNYFNSTYRLQTIQFADGTTWDYAAVTGKLVYTGTAGKLNDILAGGTGDDTLNAGSGIDTFVFNQGDGQDRIVETGSYNKTGAKNQDVLQLGAGLLASATQLVRGTGSASNDLTLVFGGGDQVTLSNYFNSSFRLQTIQFADGTAWDYAAVTGKLVYTCTAGNDTLTGLTYAVNNIDGGAGNDTLTGCTLNDTLVGGIGDDTLAGGTGNDTYLFNRGDGADSISEVDSTVGNTDVAQFGGAISSEQLWFRHVGNHLEVSVIGTSDKMTLQNWYSGAAYRVEQFKTSDGKLLLDSQVENLVSAMAAFAPPSAGQTTLPQNYQEALTPKLAANWQ